MKIFSLFLDFFYYFSFSFFLEQNSQTGRHFSQRNFSIGMGLWQFWRFYLFLAGSKTPKTFSILFDQFSLFVISVLLASLLFNIDFSSIGQWFFVFIAEHIYTEFFLQFYCRISPSNRLDLFFSASFFSRKREKQFSTFL